MIRAERARDILAILRGVALAIVIVLGAYSVRRVFDWGAEHGRLAQGLECRESIALIEGQMLEQSRFIAELEKKFAPDPMRRP